MIQDDECIQTLMGLRLTLLQAKTYLALATLGKADIKTISKASNVARQDIYRIMRTLQKLGLAEKMITTPVMYKATPIKDGVSILLQHRTREYTELQKKTRKLVNNFQNNSQKNNIITTLQEDSQFIFISAKTKFVKRHEKATQKAQASIDFIGSREVFRALLFYGLQDFKRAIKRSVKIRMITEKSEDEESIPKVAQVLEKNLFFEVRYISAPAQIGMMIFDKKEFNLSVSDREWPSLWSNNSNILKLATSYFDDLWNKAQENPSLRKPQKRALRAKTQNRNNRRRKTLNTQQS
jgi:sugar-specific transcriptional regulator TrmB